MQLLLQVLHQRGGPVGTHPQTQGVETPQDTHLPILWKVLHARDIPGKTHAEAHRQVSTIQFQSIIQSQ